MWGSIPYHAHHFLIRFAIGVRTTIELMKTYNILLKSMNTAVNLSYDSNVNKYPFLAACIGV